MNVGRTINVALTSTIDFLIGWPGEPMGFGAAYTSPCWCPLFVCTYGILFRCVDTTIRDETTGGFVCSYATLARDTDRLLYFRTNERTNERQLVPMRFGKHARRIRNRVANIPVRSPVQDAIYNFTAARYDRAQSVSGAIELPSYNPCPRHVFDRRYRTIVSGSPRLRSSLGIIERTSGHRRRVATA